MVMGTKVAGFILRAKESGETERFYRELGLKTKEHAHGGPLHIEMGPLSDKAVLEIYPHSVRYPIDALMLYIDSLSDALAVAARFNAGVWILKETEQTRAAYVTDPDGRAVLLLETK